MNAVNKRWNILLLLLLLSVAGKIDAQKVAEKTNLFYWATGTPNIGAEVALSNRWTVDFSTGYNPWELPNEMTLRHWTARVEPRFWLWKPFMGHFVGAHATYAQYNIGNISFIPGLEEHRYKGNLYGGGLTYGYHFVLKGRWGLELSVSAGYLQIDYDKYYCTGCSELVDQVSRSYIGPTWAGVSLIYLLH